MSSNESSEGSSDESSDDDDGEVERGFDCFLLRKEAVRYAKIKSCLESQLKSTDPNVAAQAAEACKLLEEQITGFLTALTTNCQLSEDTRNGYWDKYKSDALAVAADAENATLTEATTSTNNSEEQDNETKSNGAPRRKTRKKKPVLTSVDISVVSSRFLKRLQEMRLVELKDRPQLLVGSSAVYNSVIRQYISMFKNPSKDFTKLLLVLLTNLNRTMQTTWKIVLAHSTVLNSKNSKNKKILQLMSLSGNGADVQKNVDQMQDIVDQNESESSEDVANLSDSKTLVAAAIKEVKATKKKNYTTNCSLFNNDEAFVKRYNGFKKKERLLSMGSDVTRLLSMLISACNATNVLRMIPLEILLSADSLSTAESLANSINYEPVDFSSISAISAACFLNNVIKPCLVSSETGIQDKANQIVYEIEIASTNVNGNSFIARAWNTVDHQAFLKMCDFSSLSDNFLPGGYFTGDSSASIPDINVKRCARCMRVVMAQLTSVQLKLKFQTIVPSNSLDQIIYLSPTKLQDYFPSNIMSVDLESLEQRNEQKYFTFMKNIATCTSLINLRSLSFKSILHFILTGNEDIFQEEYLSLKMILKEV